MTAEEKLRLVALSVVLSEAELDAMLRREGVDAAQLAQWRAAMLATLAPKAEATGSEPAARAGAVAAGAVRPAERDDEAARFTEKIAQVGSAVTRELALSAIVDVVLTQTIDTLGARFAHVYLANEEEHSLKLLGQRNLPEDLLHEFSDVSFDAPILAARAASTRRAQLLPAIDQLDPAMQLARELLSRTACQSMVSLPLLARGHLVGVLTFGMATSHDFSPEQSAALDNCAEIFAFSIQNAVAFEEERRLRALFEAVRGATIAITAEIELRPVLQNIVEEAREIVDAEFAALGIAGSPERPFDPWVFSGITTEQERRIGRHPRPVGTLGVVAQGDQAIRTADVRLHPAFKGLPEHHPPLTSFLGVPIQRNGRSVGNLYLANKRGAAEFTRED